MPAAAAAISAAKRATTPAATTPPAKPQETQNPRRGAPVLAARTMPTISAASSTSRNTMIAAPSIWTILLFHNDVTTRSGRVEVAEKFVPPGLERADIDGDLFSAGDHLLAPELGAFEFFRCWIVIFHNQSNFLADRDLDFGRPEFVVLDYEHVGWFLRRGGSSGSQNQGKRKECGAVHSLFREIVMKANATESHFYRRRIALASKIVIEVRN